jgi:hypothetical protein
MTDEDKEDVVESQKLTPKDKKEIQEGACVNCALVSFIFIVVSALIMIL